MAITTAEQLLKAGEIGRCELIRGELRMMIPAGDEHGRITVTLTHAVASHVLARRLGVLHGAETGFILSRDPDTVRAPDLAFTRAARASPQRNSSMPAWSAASGACWLSGWRSSSSIGMPFGTCSTSICSRQCS